MRIDPNLCWVISDGRRGIENQALGLAEAVARIHPFNINVKTINSQGAFKAMPPALQLTKKPNPQDYQLTPPYPRLAIGCGRQAIAPLRALKKTFSADIFTVYVQSPRINSKHFDLVIAPEHDQTKGKNVLQMVGSPNRVTPNRILEDTTKFIKAVKALNAPRVAILIGGKSKTHTFSRAAHTKHLNAVHTLLGQGISVMITTSRRTPQWANKDYENLAKTSNRVWYWDGSYENPYFAFLGAANAILVTEDSTNMLTEACATGKPVYTLLMDGQPKKFERLYTALQERCGVIPFTGMIDKYKYVPLDETKRMAQCVISAMADKDT